MTESPRSPEAVLDFWLNQEEELYFKQDDAFDALLKEKFSGTLAAAKAGALDHWQDSADGATWRCSDGTCFGGLGEGHVAGRNDQSSTSKAGTRLNSRKLAVAIRRPWVRQAAASQRS